MISFPEHASPWSRRRFLSFMGRTGAAAWAAGSLPGLLSSCTHSKRSTSLGTSGLPFEPLPPKRTDALELARGFEWQLLVKRDEVITPKGELFGSDSDFIAFLPDPRPASGTTESGILWVNHEAFTPIFVHGQARARNKNEVLMEMNALGGSILRIERTQARGWEIRKNHSENKRLTALTPISFAWPEPIAGSRQAIGTLSNCCGGKTPWGTILTCEENPQNFYGEVSFKDGKRLLRAPKYGLAWHEYFNPPPEHYGWVVEVDPKSGQAQKLVALGRFAHEGATVHRSKSGKPVVYMGDDADDQCVYKFVAEKNDSLKTGTLYVANFEKNRWIPLDLKLTPSLQKYFSSQTELLIRTREAALLVGGTPLHRPEDIEVDPLNGHLIVALTNHKKKGDPYGSLLKIVEKNGDHAGTEFEHRTLISGGPSAGFACPDNLAFDPKGGLWFSTDISTSSIGRAPYESFGNNSLFYVPLSGASAGEALRVASAPHDAEFTGLEFNPSGDTLWVSVQHPGEASPSLDRLTSHWPEGKKSVPKCSIVAITGGFLG